MALAQKDALEALQQAAGAYATLGRKFVKEVRWKHLCEQESDFAPGGFIPEPFGGYWTKHAEWYAYRQPWQADS